MQRFVCTTARGALLMFTSLVPLGAYAPGTLMVTALAISVGAGAQPVQAQTTPPPDPSETSAVGDPVTNPVIMPNFGLCRADMQNLLCCS